MRETQTDSPGVIEGTPYAEMLDDAHRRIFTLEGHVRAIRDVLCLISGPNDSSNALYLGMISDLATQVLELMPVTIELSDTTAQRILNWHRAELAGEGDPGDDLLRLVASYIKEVQKVEADPGLIQEIWNQTFEPHPEVPKVQDLRRSRRRMSHLRQRWAEMERAGRDPAAVFAQCFTYMALTPWFLGENNRKWVVTFDYLLQNDTKWRQIIARCEAQAAGGEPDREWRDLDIIPPV